jgi:formylglycine-generating enzyme required for sulfatase activity
MVPAVVLADVKLSAVTILQGSMPARLEIRYALEWSGPATGKTVEGKLVVSIGNASGDPLEIPLSLPAGQETVTIGIHDSLACGNTYRMALQADDFASPELEVSFDETGLAERLSLLAAARMSLPLLAPGPGYRDDFPVPGGDGTVWVELRPEGDGEPVRLPPSVYRSAATSWQSAAYIATLPELPAGRLYQRFYQYRSASGLRSTWQAAGQLRTGPVDGFKLLGPVEGSATLCAAPAFRWQSISGEAGATIAFSANAPESTAFRADSLTVIPASNGQAPGDLRAFLPGLKPGTVFWWQVRHGGQIADSPWQTARFDPFLDDTVIALAKGYSVAFTMGSESGPPDQRPLRRVELHRAFAIQRQVFTNDQFAAIANAMISQGVAAVSQGALRDPADGSVIAGLAKLDYGVQLGLQESPKGRLSALPGKGGHPVIGVTWQGTQALCRFIALATGLKDGAAWRLPTEAEWEFVASQGNGLATPWGGKASSASANFLRSGDRFEDPLPPHTRQGGPTVPADWFSTQRLALSRNAKSGGRSLSADLAKVQLIGNVWEWCSDWYLPTGFDPLELVDPAGPADLGKDQLKSLTVIGQRPSRVVKGGAWNSGADELYAQNRGKYPPDRTSYSIGFRLVRSLP